MSHSCNSYAKCYSDRRFSPGLPSALAADGGRLALLLSSNGALAKAVARDDGLAGALAAEGGGGAQLAVALAACPGLAAAVVAGTEAAAAVLSRPALYAVVSKSPTTFDSLSRDPRLAAAVARSPLLREQLAQSPALSLALGSPDGRLAAEVLSELQHQGLRKPSPSRSSAIAAFPSSAFDPDSREKSQPVSDGDDDFDPAVVRLLAAHRRLLLAATTAPWGPRLAASLADLVAEARSEAYPVSAASSPAVSQASAVEAVAQLLEDKGLASREGPNDQTVAKLVRARGQWLTDERLISVVDCLPRLLPFKGGTDPGELLRRPRGLTRQARCRDLRRAGEGRRVPCQARRGGARGGEAAGLISV